MLVVTRGEHDVEQAETFTVNSEVADGGGGGGGGGGDNDDNPTTPVIDTPDGDGYIPPTATPTPTPTPETGTTDGTPTTPD